MREDLMRAEAFALVEHAETALARAIEADDHAGAVEHLRELHDALQGFRAKWHAVGNRLAGNTAPDADVEG